MSNKLNIWIINHYATGPGRHHNFAKELTGLGHNVTLFATSFKHYAYQETREYPGNRYYLEEWHSGYRRIFIKTPPYYSNGVKRLINQMVFGHRMAYIDSKLSMEEKPNVIIGSSIHLFTGLAAYRLAKKYGVPFLFEVRDLWPQTLIDLGAIKKRGIVALVFGAMEKYLYQKADVIISLLPHAYRYIEGLGISRDKVVHIPNGVDLRWFDEHISDQLEDSLEQFFERHLEKFIVTYAGAFGMANGVDTVIHAAKRLQDGGNANIQFLLIGEGPEKASLVEMANQYGLRNVTFHKGVPKDMVPRLLKESDLCLSVVRKSKVHRFGISMNKIFDYLASGKPMVSALEASFDFADVAKCGIAIPPDDPEAMANAVLKVANMSLDEREQLGANGRAYVEEHHDFPVLTQKLLSVIEKAVTNLKK